MGVADPFIDALVESAEHDPNVVGLVLCGSSAETGRRDQWSDHDFLMITEDGLQESYRTDLSWLPVHGSIAWSFRETAHGLKALYRSGLMVEFAVFDRAEFAGCALNHASVVVDRGGISDLAAEVRSRSLVPRPTDPLNEFRNFLALVYLGTGRARRGELLSANVLVRTFAVEHLLRLVRDLFPDDLQGRLDQLDVWRRFERLDPSLAAEVDAALALDVAEVGRALMDVAGSHLPGMWPAYPHADAAIVRNLLGW
jgi:hypothetical protein